MIRAALVSLLALSLVACASEGPPRGRGGPSGRPAPGAPEQGPRARVFISPAGEPFRAPPGAPPGGPDPIRAWFDAADANHDGALSRAEFLADHMRFFAKLDTNGDGAVAGSEVSRYEEVVAPELLNAFDRGQDGGPGAGPRRGGQRGGVPPGGGRRGGGLNAVDDGPIRLGRPREPEAPPQARTVRPRLIALFADPEPVRAADANLDFRVTVAEWAAMAGARFDRLDTDRNGVVPFTELKPLGAETPPAQGRDAGRVDPRAGGR